MIDRNVKISGRSAGWLFALLLACCPLSLMADQPLSEAEREAVEGVISGQISAFQSDDYQSAYSFAAPNVRAVFPTVEIFISMVQKDYMPLYRPVAYTFGRSSLEANEVLQELLVTDDENRLWQVIYSLELQEDQSWKVTNVLMFPYKGISA